MDMSEGTNITCLLLEDGVKCGNITYSSCSEGPFTPSDALFWVYLAVFMMLVVLAGEKPSHNNLDICAQGTRHKTMSGFP